MHLLAKEEKDLCYSTVEAAQQLKCSDKHLINLRRRGEGPAYFRLGNLVRYSVDSIENFINLQKPE